MGSFQKQTANAAGRLPQYRSFEAIEVGTENLFKNVTSRWQLSADGTQKPDILIDARHSDTSLCQIDAAAILWTLIKRPDHYENS